MHVTFSTRHDMIEYITRSWVGQDGFTWRCIAYTCRDSSKVWAVWENSTGRRYITCTQIAHTGSVWSFSSIPGRLPIDCPPAYIGLVSVKSLDADWLRGVLAYNITTAYNKQPKITLDLKIGMRVHLRNCGMPSATIVALKPLVVVGSNGCARKVPRLAVTGVSLV